MVKECHSILKTFYFYTSWEMGTRRISDFFYCANAMLIFRVHDANFLWNCSFLRWPFLCLLGRGETRMMSNRFVYDFLVNMICHSCYKGILLLFTFFGIIQNSWTKVSPNVVLVLADDLGYGLSYLFVTNNNIKRKFGKCLKQVTITLYFRGSVIVWSPIFPYTSFG